VLNMLKNWLKRTAAPGVSIAIEDGHQIRCFSEGVSDLRANLPVCDETEFQLGSVSKLITAFVLLETLADRNASVDTPVVTIAPDLKASNESAFHNVTIRQLLCHTSGLDSQWRAEFGRGEGASKMAARAIAAMPLIARPSELFSYSGPAYVLAGYITELLSGRCWEEHVWLTVAKYLNYHSISARPEQVLLKPSAIGYVALPEGDGAPMPAARWYAPLALSPGGGLVGTPADVAKLMRAVRDRLGLSPVPARQMAAAFAAPTVGWRYEGWGLGIAKYRLADRSTCWGHDGTTSGQGYAVRLCEERPETVIVATNAAWAASQAGKLAEEIIGRITGGVDSARVEYRRDAMASYDAWRLPPAEDLSESYIRLNHTTLVRSGSGAELIVEEIYSPQDEANWFGKEDPRGTNGVMEQFKLVERHSYASISKKLHFLRHPDAPGRIYAHDGMRASVRTARPWI